MFEINLSVLQLLKLQKPGKVILSRGFIKQITGLSILKLGGNHGDSLVGINQKSGNQGEKTDENHREICTTGAYAGQSDTHKQVIKLGSHGLFLSRLHICIDFCSLMPWANIPDSLYIAADHRFGVQTDITSGAQPQRIQVNIQIPTAGIYVEIHGGLRCDCFFNGSILQEPRAAATIGEHGDVKKCNDPMDPSDHRPPRTYAVVKNNAVPIPYRNGVRLDNTKPVHRIHDPIRTRIFRVFFIIVPLRPHRYRYR